MHLIYEFHYAGEDEREKVLALQLALNATEITCKYVTTNHGMKIQVDNILILLLLFNNVLTHMTRAEIYSNRGPLHPSFLSENIEFIFIHRDYWLSIQIRVTLPFPLSA